MRKTTILLTMLVMLITSCSSPIEEDFPPLPREEENESTKPDLTVAAFDVPIEDVIFFLNATDERVKTRSTSYNIEPIAYEDDTIVYIVNYNEGWKVFSADKRTPIVLAESKEGKFDIRNDSIHMLWIENIGREVLYIKKYGDETTNTKYVDSWNVFSKESVYSKADTRNYGEGY